MMMTLRNHKTDVSYINSMKGNSDTLLNTIDQSRPEKSPVHVMDHFDHDYVTQNKTLQFVEIDPRFDLLPSV